MQGQFMKKSKKIKQELQNRRESAKYRVDPVSIESEPIEQNMMNC